jgi:hypothetical protein
VEIFTAYPVQHHKNVLEATSMPRGDPSQEMKQIRGRVEHEFVSTVEDIRKLFVQSHVRATCVPAAIASVLRLKVARSRARMCLSFFTTGLMRDVIESAFAAATSTGQLFTFKDVPKV